RDLRDYIRLLCKYKGVEIIEGHMMPDHVHLLVSISPKLSVSQFMGYLKGKSALMMFDRHFWAEGYYVSTVGLNESTIKKYIRDQEKHDIAM
ncbi:IS200/IS605 family transposase, partial [Limosilactobacillus reuteri]|uniref:IS200/IS605 family transposase n=1 Tax=Limosilactobacillus reuteri TaxID=1598 RepID=UPI001E2B35F3